MSGPQSCHHLLKQQLRLFPVSASSTHQFPGNQKHGAHTWNEKNNSPKEKIYTKNKSCIWPLLVLVYIKKKIDVHLRGTVTHFPPNHCYPLRNHTEYSTSRFVILHLNCKTRGHGTERRILPSLH